MSRPAGARWLVPAGSTAPAPGAAPPGAPPPGTPAQLPPFVPPPGIRPRQPAVAPVPDVAWPVAIARGTCVGLLAALLGLMFWSVLPAVAGWRAQVVLTGSMRPRIQPGDLVLAAPLHPGDLQRGRILLFRDPAHPRRTLVHRLVRFDANSDLITKGDANQSEDSTPVPAGSVLGLPRLRVPFVGRPVVWVRQGRTGNLLVASTLLTAAGALLLWPAGTTPRPGEPVRSHRRRGQRG